MEQNYPVDNGSSFSNEPLNFSHSSSAEETNISYPSSPSLSITPTFITTKNVSKQQLPINVIFRKVEESYAVGADVEVFYTLLGGLELSLKDWIGLYKVGWRSHHDYIYYDWSPFPEDYCKEAEVHNKVLFSGSKMPKEDGDFYQFCFVSSGGQVQGASTPFQFKEACEDDLVVVEEDGFELEGCEDDGLMIVKTRKDQLLDQLKKVTLENVALSKKLLSMETKLEVAYGKEAEMKDSMGKMVQNESSVSKLNEERLEQLQECKQQSEYLQGCIAGVQEKMDVLNQEKTSMERRLDDSDGYISSLQEKIKTLVTEKDLLQGRVNSQEDENNAIKSYSRHLMGECEEKVKRMKLTEVESSVWLVKCADDLKKVKTSMAYLSDKLQNSEDKLGAAEHCKKMLNEEVVELKTQLESVEALAREMHKELDGKMKELEEKRRAFEGRESELKEKDGQLEAINGQLKEFDLKFGGKLVEEVKKQLDGLNGKLQEKDMEIDAKDKELERKGIEIEGVVSEMEEMKGVCEGKERQLGELEGSMYALESAHKVLLQRVSGQQKKLSTHVKKEVDKKEREAHTHVHKQVCTEEAATSSESSKHTGGSDQCPLIHKKVSMYKRLYWEEYELNDSLRTSLEEKEKEIKSLSEKLQKLSQPITINELLVDTGLNGICEEERFVDALNDYTVDTHSGSDESEEEVSDEDDDTKEDDGREGVFRARYGVAEGGADANIIRSCPFCPVEWEEGVAEDSMMAHVERHMQEDVPECPMCHLTFSAPLLLIQHAQTHFE